MTLIWDMTSKAQATKAKIMMDSIKLKNCYKAKETME
jgi:hypothetical protein